MLVPLASPSRGACSPMNTLSLSTLIVFRTIAACWWISRHEQTVQYATEPLGLLPMPTSRTHPAVSLGALLCASPETPPVVLTHLLVRSPLLRLCISAPSATIFRLSCLATMSSIGYLCLSQEALITVLFFVFYFSLANFSVQHFHNIARHIVLFQSSIQTNCLKILRLPWNCSIYNSKSLAPHVFCTKLAGYKRNFTFHNFTFDFFFFCSSYFIRNLLPGSKGFSSVTILNYCWRLHSSIRLRTWRIRPLFNLFVAVLIHSSGTCFIYC